MELNYKISLKITLKLVYYYLYCYIAYLAIIKTNLKIN